MAELMRVARAARDVAAPVFKLILTLSVARLTGSVRDKVKAGQPIFKLDSSKQEAALETARPRW